MVAQKGGYIVIDCTPLWIENGKIAYEDGKFDEYAATDQEINKILYNATINKKPIILNNLKLYDVANEGTYIYNGLVAHTTDFIDDRGGGYYVIKVYTEDWDISFDCGIDSVGQYSLNIYGRKKQ